MKSLSLLCLLAATCVATAASAQTAPAAPAGSDCITLSGDTQIVRRNADRSVLLRNGSDHYIVNLAQSCSSATVSKRLDFVTEGQEGQLCGARATALKTDQQSCDVTDIKAISADEFTRRARR